MHCLYSSDQKFPDSSFYDWKNATNFVLSIKMKFISILCWHFFRSNHCCTPTRHRLYKTFYQGDMLFHSLFSDLYKLVLLECFCCRARCFISCYKFSMGLIWTNGPTPSVEKMLHTIILSPPCLTVGISSPTYVRCPVLGKRYDARYLIKPFQQDWLV